MWFWAIFIMESKEFIRILGTKYDLGDVVIITDILNKYGDYWKDDNDGKALIDIQCDGAIKYALLIRNNTLCKSFRIYVMESLDRIHTSK